MASLHARILLSLTCLCIFASMSLHRAANSFAATRFHVDGSAKAVPFVRTVALVLSLRS